MNTYTRYYTDYLYPLQSGIIRKIGETGSPFYLTGGTALSRCYFHHRYSVDFFVNNEQNYSLYVRDIINVLLKYQKDLDYSLEKNNIVASEYYTKITINKKSHEYNVIQLQIDLINDTAVHFGEITIHKEFGKIDNVRNILSNKITALYRLEPKDVVDIWTISKHMKLRWPNILAEAKQKELGVDPVSVSAIIQDFPVELLDSIKWNMEIDKKMFAEDLKLISEDILLERENRLFSSHKSTI